MAPDDGRGQNMRTAMCSCGQLTAIVIGDPIRVSVCHCLACQRRTGSVFGAQARFPATSVTIQGESREYIRTGDSGGRCHFRFCPACGATVFYTLADTPEQIAIPVGAFADPKFSASYALGLRGANALVGRRAQGHRASAMKAQWRKSDVPREVSSRESS